MTKTTNENYIYAHRKLDDEGYKLRSIQALLPRNLLITYQQNRAGEELGRQILEDLGEGGVVKVEKVRMDGLVWEQVDRNEVEMALSKSRRT